MRAYYFDDVPGDQRLPHDSGVPVDLSTLTAIGVQAWTIPIPDPASPFDNPVDIIANKRGYKTREVMRITQELLGDKFESTLAIYFSEHMHDQEEIRCVLEGGGYFDVREHPTDKWIRCAVDPGDAILLPAGMYHRFTIDDRNMVMAMLWFQDREKWVPQYRGEESEANPFRIEYLESITVN